MIVTTSWDDGAKSDLKIAELLNKYGLKGTFYIPKTCALRTLADSEVKELDEVYEIGAHDLNNDHLIQLTPAEINEQISGAKKYIEDLLGKEVKMFSYPCGEYNKIVKEIVKKNGFLGARTVKEFCFKKPNDFFEMGTTIHLYPFPLRKRDAQHYHLTQFLFQPLSRKFFKILKTRLSLNSFVSWFNLAKNLVDYTKEKDGIFHLWGHSWELDKYQMWGDLERLFQYLSQQQARYLTNSQVLEKYNYLR